MFVRKVTMVGIVVTAGVSVWRWRKLPKPMGLQQWKAASSSSSSSSSSSAAAAAATDASSLFTSGASYGSFRPTYPRALYERVQAYADAGAAGKQPRRLAVDVGAGTGQATVPLRTILGYERVIGVEDSDEQRKAAVPHDGVSYLKGRAESLPVPTGAADLITVAQAAHWFTLEQFWKEAHRALRADGTLAIWSYGLLSLDNPKASEVLLKYHTSTMGPYWDHRRALVDGNYKDIVMPQELFNNTERHHLDMNLWEGKEVSLAFLRDYLGTWSSFKTFRDRHPHAPDPRQPLLEELLRCYAGGTDGKASPAEKIAVQARFKVTLLLGKKNTI